MSRSRTPLASIFLIVFVLAVSGLVISFIGWPYYPFLNRVLDVSLLTLIALIPFGVAIVFRSSQVPEKPRDEVSAVLLAAPGDLPKRVSSTHDAKPRVSFLVLLCILACGALLVRIIVFNLG